MNDAKQATPAAELERQICSATEPKNEREWWAHHEIARLRDRLAVETLALVETIARAKRAEARLVALEDEKNTYIDYVGDALGQDHDGESLWDAAQRVLSERDRLRAAGRSLLACPHIAARDTDPDWVDAETEAAVAEMRAALKEGGQ